MLTPRDVVTALIGGLLAGTVAFAAQNALGDGPAVAAQQSQHHVTAIKTVSCQLGVKAAARTS